MTDKMKKIYNDECCAIDLANNPNNGLTSTGFLIASSFSFLFWYVTYKFLHLVVILCQNA